MTGAPGITNFGWLTSATMAEVNNNSSPQNIKHLKAERELPVWSKVSDPEKVCVFDQGGGILKVRFYYVPGSTIWAVNLVYQAAAPLLTSLTQTWTPIPDQFSSMYRQALIYRMYRYINSARTEAEYQKLQQEIAKASGADNAEESNVFLSPEDPLQDIPLYWTGF